MVSLRELLGRRLTQALVAIIGVSLVVLPSAHAALTHGDVLRLSFQFYEAQTSGVFPAWSSLKASSGATIAYRGNSHTSDGVNTDGTVTTYYPNVDLSGGWYEGGGHIKNSQTMGAAASLLAYGALTWKDTLPSGVWDSAVNNVKTVAEYFYKAYINLQADGVNTFVAQIGDSYTEDRYWGRPEDQLQGGSEGSDSWRPVYEVNPSEGRGTDVLSQAIAALEAASIMAYQDGRTDDCTNYHDAAVGLYGYAQSTAGVYIIPEGNITVLSRTYRDDYAWAMSWMCRYEKATGAAPTMCESAVAAWESMQELRGEQYMLSADVMYLAVALHMRDLFLDYSVGSITYLTAYNALIDYALTKWFDAESVSCTSCNDEDICKTNMGFMVIQEVGSASYTANMALVALASARVSISPWFDLDPATQKTRQCWAYRQVSYLLGNNTAKQAYVAGLDQAASWDSSSGISFPTRPRHRGSACTATACASGDEVNPNPLVGALVGGPTEMDSYTDSRTSLQNIVSIEYNAGFTAALAGLNSLDSLFAAADPPSSWAEYCA